MAAHRVRQQKARCCKRRSHRIPRIQQSRNARIAVRAGAPRRDPGAAELAPDHSRAQRDPRRLRAEVAQCRPSLSLLVPATMAAVIAHPQWHKTDLSSLKMLNTGSMVVPDSLIRAFHQRGVPVGQIYGATETAPIAIVLLREDALRKAGSAGKPAPHCEVKLVDGEIWVRGPARMRGYWKDYSGLTPEGWFRTGDLARLDEDGFYWIV